MLRFNGSCTAITGATSDLNTGDDMADDTPQRPYRSNLPPTRGPAASIAAPAAAGSDPLAELARLIGQNDPFSEFGNEAGRRPAAANANANAANNVPRQHEAALDWPPQGQSHGQGQGQPQGRAIPRDLPPVPPRTGYGARMPEPAVSPSVDSQAYGAGGFDRPPFGENLYPAGGPQRHDIPGYAPPAPGYPPQAPGYAPQAYGVPGYQSPLGGEFDHPPDAFGADYGQDPYRQNQDPHQDPRFGSFGHEDEDYYDDTPSGGRRIGIIAIAGIFALAVIGTAGAFGYRAIFGSTASSGPPPVIKADTAPIKIVPASTSREDNKLASLRANDNGQGERLVSREEQPVAVTTAKPANIVFPQDAAQGQGQIQNNPAQLGSGIVGGDPKRIHTLVIRPDQVDSASAGGATVDASPMQSMAPQQAAPQPRVTNIAPARSAAPPPRQAVETAPRPTVARAAPEPAGNAPLSLSPTASVSRRAPQRTAAASPPARLAPETAGGGYAVQVTARRNESDAKAAFRSLQSKYPDQLGRRQPMFKRVDLGAKGVYYRAMVGPFGSSAEANEVCSSLKAAGGACIVQKN